VIRARGCPAFDLSAHGNSGPAFTRPFLEGICRKRSRPLKGDLIGADGRLQRFSLPIGKKEMRKFIFFDPK
jgi:hypothetical protein